MRREKNISMSECFPLEVYPLPLTDTDQIFCGKCLSTYHFVNIMVHLYCIYHKYSDSNIIILS